MVYTPCRWRFLAAGTLLAASVLVAPPVVLAAPSDRYSLPFEAPAVAPKGAELLRQAEAGDAQAQFEIGLAYQLGYGIGRDLNRARLWFGRAADQDHPRALAGLGFLMLLGQGGPRDLSGAERVLRRAADLGEPTARANLAELMLELRPDDPEIAVDLLERAVAAGAVNARYRLGRFLIEGDLVAADQRRGLRLLEEAAAQGSLHAKTYSAYLLNESGIVPRDPQQALRLVKEAADAGLAEALNELGRYYAFGIGVGRDARQGAQLFAEAAALGDPNGWYNLALLHRDGALGAANLPQARQFALRAARAGHIAGSALAGRMLFRGEGGGADAAAAAMPYLQRAAEAGEGDAQNYLALILFNGRPGVAPDPAAAMDWWERAVAQGHGAATNNFATYLAHGIGRPANPKRAGELIAGQADRGYAPAQFRWALWLEQGWKGTERDLPAAIGWFRRAAQNGHAAAALKYAAYLEAGEGVPMDTAAANRWYRIAAERGNPAAQFQVAQMLLSDSGEIADEAAIKDGFAWLERAARQGFAPALNMLGDFAFRGEKRPADPVTAWVYFRLAEHLGLAEAGGNRRYVEERLLPFERQHAAAMAQQLAASIHREGDDE